MKNVNAKILKARKTISETPIKKEGYNSYGKYHFFTPSQISHLVSTTCAELNLLTDYSLKCGEYGYYGEFSVTDIDSDETKVYSMVTAMPEITATNASQKLGGMATFNERYLKMSVFEIVDNNLDFDTQDNREKTTEPKPQRQTATPTKVALSKEKFDAMIVAAADKAQHARVKKGMESYILTDSQKQQLDMLLGGK